MNNRIGLQNKHTCYSQQLEIYVQQGITNKGPRKAIVEELRDLILKQFYTPDNYLLIGIDANAIKPRKAKPFYL